MLKNNNKRCQNAIEGGAVGLQGDIMQFVCIGQKLYLNELNYNNENNINCEKADKFVRIGKL